MESIAYIASGNCQEKLLLHLIVNFAKTKKGGCTMGGPLSVTFSNIYMTKMERDVVGPFNSVLYRRYVNDI